MLGLLPLQRRGPDLNISASRPAAPKFLITKLLQLQ
jgi:hypothetical protein